MKRLLTVLSCGKHLIRYSDGLKAQELLAEARKVDIIQDTVILLQHLPVYTIGKRGSQEDFKLPLQEVLQRGAEVVNVPRGGQLTYHGPGQLVAYPVLGLRSAGLGARAYVEGLEDAIIAAVGRYGITARGRMPGATGVWVGERKVAAIGVKISHGVSTHGIALNVHTDLAAFDLIVPCGIADKDVTSVWRELQQQQQQQHGMTGGAGPAGSRRDSPCVPTTSSSSGSTTRPLTDSTSSTNHGSGCSSSSSSSSRGMHGDQGPSAASSNCMGHMGHMGHMAAAWCLAKSRACHLPSCEKRV